MSQSRTEKNLFYYCDFKLSQVTEMKSRPNRTGIGVLGDDPIISNSVLLLNLSARIFNLGL